MNAHYRFTRKIKDKKFSIIIMSIIQNLTSYGAKISDCILLDNRQDHRILKYVDLLVDENSPPIIDVVVESHSRPVLYIIQKDRLIDSNENGYLIELRRKLAMRAEIAFLGLLGHGELEVYPINLNANNNDKSTKILVEEDSSMNFIPRLVNDDNRNIEKSSLQIRNILFRLVTDANKELVDLGLSIEESLALTGRALFIRFVIDRKIVTKENLIDITKHADSLDLCFSNLQSLIDTNFWFDRIFNGELLKLPSENYVEYFSSLVSNHGKKIFEPLSSILELYEFTRSDEVQLKLRYKWSDLYFNHIPVGLLSEIYEELIDRFQPDVRRNTSVYYTPSHLTNYMVMESLYNHPQGSSCKFLDPACGAGIFLTTALRCLVELRFKEKGRWPNRQEIRDILNSQLVGFDINSHARTLAALGLYLTSLELDPEPSPLFDLKFEKMEGRVLIDVSQNTNSNSHESTLGSIDDFTTNKYKNYFDIVIGNPPWTALPGKEKILGDLFTEKCKRIALNRGLSDVAKKYENPNKVTDLPFLWCAMEWAKADIGIICFALAGRFLFKKTPANIEARSAIFQSLRITGILNGAALRSTKLWPNVSQPFFLLFAKNRIPKITDEFIYISPELEPNLNNKGVMRIEESNAKKIRNSDVIKNPNIFKILFRGTYNDVKIISYMKSNKLTLEEFLKNNSGNFGVGYKTEKKKDDAFLNGIRLIDKNYLAHPFYIRTEILEKYIPVGLSTPRNIEIYKAPLVVLRKTFSPNRESGRALLSLENVVYPEIFYGFSTSGMEDSNFIAKYFLVLFNSTLFEYFNLMISSEFGVEREVVQLMDVKEFPLIVTKELTQYQRKKIEFIANELINGKVDFHLLDSFVFDLYKLNADSVQNIIDVIETRSPFTISKTKANRQVNQMEIDNFFKHLVTKLNELFLRVNIKVEIKSLKKTAGSPWVFFEIYRKKIEYKKNTAYIINIPDVVSDYHLSKITIINNEQKTITVGILDRYRYWTITQATQLATQIIWQYGNILEEDTNCLD